VKECCFVNVVISLYRRRVSIKQYEQHHQKAHNNDDNQAVTATTSQMTVFASIPKAIILEVAVCFPLWNELNHDCNLPAVAKFN
jgi:hypothetical protein